MPRLTARHKASIRERIEMRVERITESGCWIWTGALHRTTRGYGVMGFKGRLHLAHRLSYEEHRGPIPEGLQIDHLCRVTECVNPWHLEPVTPRENTLRGTSMSSIHAKKTACPRGHAYTHVRDGQRKCRTCERDRQRERSQDEAVRAARRESDRRRYASRKADAQPKPLLTTFDAMDHERYMERQG